MINPTPELVSVILPVRNEADHIEAAIESILDQSYPGDLEVVVADGMSTDGTREILDKVCSADRRVRYVDNPTGRTPNGLNIAIRASRGSVIVRCDGHSELPPDYVATAIEVMTRTGAVNVSGTAWQQIAHHCRGQSRVVQVKGKGELEIVRFKEFLP